ncbi:GNAT family N-acetyltransferase [Neobacillus niacini]|uniref:GNAT family N-acetyltransferase n=1 Tax=Neobacillus niacini TaxID=86668 RepID=UPI001C8EDD87|nr:GNAT family N-acetyltransferase [Neobacillus niacini]MBY0149354.1 GNAT family N-acetyltransferase [Neobacillus niacini]
MKCVLKPCKQEDVKEFMDDYVASLSSPFDSFLEEHISFYMIHYDEEVVGYYAIFKDTLLTQFYLKRHLYPMNKVILNEILSKHSIQSIFVSTGDELLLSSVIDQDYKINKQAYFFQDNKISIPKEKLYKEGSFSKAVDRDVDKIIEISHDFFDQLEERIRDGQIFVFSNDKSLLGVGIIEKSILQDGIASVGMFTNESVRKLGIGRTIIHHLKQWCYTNNLKPICGCWYYNDNSKLTLESAGMVSKTRLLNIQVHKE